MTKRRSLADRLADKSIPEPNSGCILWLGARLQGYGKIGDGVSKIVGAHRAAYEIEVGPIPDGWDLDHLCNNPPCINWRHLESVTKAEHRRRTAERRMRRPSCRRGHAFDDANTYWMPDGSGRSCKTCRREYVVLHREEIDAYQRAYQEQRRGTRRQAVAS